MSGLPVIRLTAAALALLQTPAWIDPAPHVSQMVAVAENVRLEVLDFGGGGGRPLVLLAGLGNTAHVFDDLAPKLTKFGHTYAITRRGYGASSRPDTGYDVSRLGEDVFQVLTSLRIEKPMLIGHSLAGQEMSYLATTHRESILALVYLDAAYRYAYDVPGEFEKDFPSLPPPPANPPAVARPTFTLPESERRQPRSSPMAGQAITAGAGPHQFTDIRLPTLAIFASPHDTGAATPDAAFDHFDEAVTEQQARAFERGVPGARVLRWPHASHYLFLTRQSDVLEEIATFIGSLR